MNAAHIKKKSGQMLASLITRALDRVRVTRNPVVRAYDGFGDEDEIVIYGHVLNVSPRKPATGKSTKLMNLLSLIRLFMVSPRINAKVRLEWNGEIQETYTDKEGFFRFEWQPRNALKPGWHPATVSYVAPVTGLNANTAVCHVYVPHTHQFSFISDIDDTFLISHSSSLLKRLRVLLTHNAVTRKAFDGVAQHYQLLARAGASGTEDNSFFYVSSSEWNLYYYIREFCAKNGLPRGVFMLGQLKRLHSVLNTGQGKHASKYIRIARILKSFPKHQYVLMGDNSQKDPEIYASVVKDFPGKIFAVYIRNVSHRKDAQTREFVERMIKAGVNCFYFRDSADAIRHSTQIGLITNA